MTALMDERRRLDYTVTTKRTHTLLLSALLLGMRVATLPGTNSDYFLYKFFEKYKIPLDQMKIVNMSPPDMIVNLTKGDLDAYFAWEPHIYFGKRELGDKVVEIPPGDLYQGFNTFNMQGEFARKNPN